jgi:hypothetical protein
MTKVTGIPQILSLLVQSSLAALLLASAIHGIHSYLDGPDESPNSERCNELTIFSQNNQVSIAAFY